MSGEVLSSVGAQEMDTSGYHVSDLEDIEFCRERNQLGALVVFRRRIGITFSPTALDDLETAGSAENPSLLEEEENKENSPPKSPTSERRIRSPALERNGSI